MLTSADVAPRDAVFLQRLMTMLTLSTLFALPTTLATRCMDAADCSLNGACVDEKCVCNAAWKGAQCDVLAFTAAPRRAGYNRRGSRSSNNISSWGGGALFSEVDRKWHMWVAEMTEHCGLNAWQSNGRIVHAVSDDEHGFGEYSFANVVFPIFSSNPTVVRGEKGEFIMLFEYSQPPPCDFAVCHCANGSTTAACNAQQEAKHCDYTTARWPSYLSYAADANGPWSTPELIPVFRDTGGQGDFNISPIILANGSAILLYRYGGGTPYESHLRLGRAAHWRNVSSYSIDNQTDLFPGLPTGGFEDPFAYRDARGGFHALLHSMVGEATCHRLADPSGVGSCGAHIFSQDGEDWRMHHPSGTYSGVVDFVADPESGLPAERLVFTRRERPHAIFAHAEGGCAPGIFEPCGEPVAVSTGVMYPPADGSFTLIQPLASAAN